MLEGENIFIAGAGGLLGRNLVKKCLDEGAVVHASDVSIESLESLFEEVSPGHKENLKIIELDLLCTESLNNYFSSCDLIDAVINCSYPRNKSYGAEFLDVKLSNFNENVNLHLGAAFNLSQAYVKYFLDKKKPMKLLNIASIYGVIAPKFDIYEGESFTMPVEYAAIKSSIVHLTKYISKYVNSSLFQVNCISPGGIFSNHDKSFVEKYSKYTNGEEMLSAEDVAEFITLLLSKKSKNLNGQNIVLDNGFSL